MRGDVYNDLPSVGNICLKMVEPGAHLLAQLKQTTVKVYDRNAYPDGVFHIVNQASSTKMSPVEALKVRIHTHTYSLYQELFVIV